MNKKSYSTPDIKVVELDSAVVCNIGVGGGSGAGLSVDYDSSSTPETGSGFDEVQEFDWRD